MFSFLSDLGNWALLVYLSPLALAFVWFLWACARAPDGYENESGFHRGEPLCRVYSFQVERERRRASLR